VPDFFFDLKKFGVHLQSLIRVSNIKFYGNPSSGSRADTCGQMARETKGGRERERERERDCERERRTEGRTDITKLRDAFRDYMKAPKNVANLSFHYYYYYYHLHMGYTGWQCTTMQDRTIQYSTIKYNNTNHTI